MIELSEVISELRRELQQAMRAGEGELLRFELGPVELEAAGQFDTIDTMWKRKAELVQQRMNAA